MFFPKVSPEAFCGTRCGPKYGKAGQDVVSGNWYGGISINVRDLLNGERVRESGGRRDKDTSRSRSPSGMTTKKGNGKDNGDSHSKPQQATASHSKPQQDIARHSKT
jgi:hypothetical protein